jgi:hypothetical protein
VAFLELNKLIPLDVKIVSDTVSLHFGLEAATFDDCVIEPGKKSILTLKI